MKRIYFKDGEGKTVYVEVSDKVAETYMEAKREAWRNDAYEGYHTTSLELQGKRAFPNRLYPTGYPVYIAISERC